MILANLADAVLGFLEGVVVGLLGLLPSFDPPAFLSDGSVASAIEDWGAYAAPMGHWVPFGTIAACLAAVAAVWVLMIVVNVLLKVYAMVRGGAS